MDNILKRTGIAMSFVMVIFSIILWLPPVNKELAWFLVPVVTMLSLIGGTWWLPARRYMIGPVIGWALLTITNVNLLSCLIVALLVCGYTLLPITWIGDSIPGHWQNWVWVWVLGLIASGVIVTIGFILHLIMMSIILSVMPFVTIGLFSTLSNINSTAKYFQWKFCELAFWTSIAVPIAFMISLS